MKEPGTVLSKKNGQDRSYFLCLLTFYEQIYERGIYLGHSCKFDRF